MFFEEFDFIFLVSWGLLFGFSGFMVFLSLVFVGRSSFIYIFFGVDVGLVRFSRRVWY